MIKIYTLSDPFTGLVRYVGKTRSTLSARMKKHLDAVKYEGYTHHNANWIRSILNKGDRPIMELIDEVPESEWIFWEQWYINLFRSWGYDLTNSTNGGDDAPEKGLLALKKFSFGKGNVPWNKGTKGVSSGAKGVSRSAELKKRISEAKKGSVPWNRGRKNSSDEIEVLIKNSPLKKRIAQFTKEGVFLREWESSRQVERETGINSGNVRKRACKLVTWLPGGFDWQYV